MLGIGDAIAIAIDQCTIGGGDDFFKTIAVVITELNISGEWSGIGRSGIGCWSWRRSGFRFRLRRWQWFRGWSRRRGRCWVRSGRGIRGDINGDGWQDLVVAVNDGSPRCFLQRPPESAAPLRVNLQGLPGNASAVGAQILAVEHDGQQSLHVLMAGEGYLTQRPPYVYLPEIPERLIVQWPDGQRSEHEVNSNVTGSMTLKHPALP